MTAPLIAFTVPGLRVKNGENTREHWGTKQKRKKKTYRAVGESWLVAKGRTALPPPPYLVVLTRVGPAKMDPDGNSTALKHVQDEVARRLGVDDGDEAKVSWQYAQEKGPYAVRVEVYRDVARARGFVNAQDLQNYLYLTGRSPHPSPPDALAEFLVNLKPDYVLKPVPLELVVKAPTYNVRLCSVGDPNPPVRRKRK